jgi:hypothetical protein
MQLCHIEGNESNFDNIVPQGIYKQKITGFYGSRKKHILRQRFLSNILSMACAQVWAQSTLIDNFHGCYYSLRGLAAAVDRQVRRWRGVRVVEGGGLENR